MIGGARAAALALLIAACTSTPAASPSAPASAAAAAASPTQVIASPTPSPTATASPGATQVAPGTFENKVLGYRITLPVTYRLWRSVIVKAHPEILGSDLYTLQTEAQERAECMKDHGDLGSPDDPGFLTVAVFRSAAGVSAADWVAARGEARLHTVEATTIGGLEAARLVQQGATDMYVFRANDRMYELSPTRGPSAYPLATIAQSFAPVASQPFPTPTPVPSLSPREAAGAVAGALALAFAARDADAVARLIGSTCSIGVGAVVAGSSTGGALNRSVALFVTALRDRFALGDLSVTVDPAVQVRTDRGGDHLFVRSDWIEADRAIRIDLELAEIDGQWRWIGATHYYPALVGRGCIPFRSPWVSPSTTAGQC